MATGSIRTSADRVNEMLVNNDLEPFHTDFLFGWVIFRIWIVVYNARQGVYLYNRLSALWIFPLGGSAEPSHDDKITTCLVPARDSDVISCLCFLSQRPGIASRAGTDRPCLLCGILPRRKAHG